MLCNPHNPAGRCYTRDALVGLMRLCEKYKIHLICDELYALSVWDNTVDTEPAPVPFVSCLAIDPTNISFHTIHWGNTDRVPLLRATTTVSFTLSNDSCSLPLA
ncbi:hypothetical protein EDB80DRAFT_455450 [Ilyonectria destructans]|nr:hypothetical protein EDB80DRAFT_455450 [Ilyonectria destructans]